MTNYAKKYATRPFLFLLSFFSQPVRTFVAVHSPLFFPYDRRERALQAANLNESSLKMTISTTPLRYILKPMAATDGERSISTILRKTRGL